MTDLVTPSPRSITLSRPFDPVADVALLALLESSEAAYRVTLTNKRMVPVQVGGSGVRPAGVRRARWAAARRLDSWRRRRNRRHGAPTRTLVRTVLVPRAALYAAPVVDVVSGEVRVEFSAT